MKYFIHITAFIFFLILTSPTSSFSQILLSKSVIGSGGSISSNEDIHLSSTLGQVVIGRGPTDNIIYEIGFWYGIKTDVSTSIHEIPNGTIDENINLTISPNPVRNFSVLKYSLKTKTKVKIELTSLTGKTYLNIDKGSLNKGHYSQEINMSGLPEGMYICRLSTPNGHQNLKVINI